MRMKVLVAVFLMVSFGSLDASYLAPNVGPFPIEKTLECLSLVKGQLVPEEPPLLPLVPVAQGDLWEPPNPVFPLYFGQPYRRINDTELQAILDNHLNATNPDGLVFKTRPVDAAPANEVIRNQADQLNCQDIELETIYSDIAPAGSLISRYLSVLSCSANFEFFSASAYYYPAFIAATKCVNSIRFMETCSIPAGANCAINRTCNAELNVLRWDCCWTWDVDTDGFVFDCGWRRVRIPFPTACLCLCNNRVNLVGLERARG